MNTLPLLNPIVDSREKLREMDPDSVKSSFSNLAFGVLMAAAAAPDYPKDNGSALEIYSTAACARQVQQGGHRGKDSCVGPRRGRKMENTEQWKELHLAMKKHPRSRDAHPVLEVTGDPSTSALTQEDMVDAVVSSFLEILFQTLADETRILTDVNKRKFRELGAELKLMQGFLKDAERLKRKNDTVRRIMVSLRVLIYEAEDMLEDCSLRAKESGGFLSGCSLLGVYPSKLPFQYRTGKRLSEINADIVKLKTNISSYLTVTVSMLQQAEGGSFHDQPNNAYSSYDHDQVVGLEADTEKIKSWLFDADQGVLAIGIVGMGGVGKTTAAQMVFNDKEVGERFDRKILLSVSKTNSKQQITKSILRSLGDVDLGDNLGELLNKIHQYLQGKRVLLVMDDVWNLENNSWWHEIYAGLPKGNGSCVIVTTRKLEVAKKMGVSEERIHWPKVLSKANSWLLFCKIAFAAEDGKCTHPELEDIGTEIVEKCKGLPLAIKAVGGIMLCKRPYNHEWRRIANNFHDELAENDDRVRASLQLSYDELPPHLKSCFLCLSLYPEDCVIPKEQLVYWWIGESFVPRRNGTLSIQTGEDCFTGLINRCLMEVVDKSYNGTIQTCRIHDMVRDLAIKMADDDAFCGTALNYRRSAIQNEKDQKHHSSANKSLRAVISTTKSGEVNRVSSSMAKKYCTFKHLRVLDVSKTIFRSPVAHLLDEIGSLKRLAYISLNNTHPLMHVPNSLQKLSYCQILDFSYCQNLKRLPTFIMNFEKLMVLDVSNCGSLEYFPKGLGRLSNLEVLLGYRPAGPNHPEGSQISELKKLTRLQTLGLELTEGDDIAEGEVDALVHLQELQFLTINCYDGHGSGLVEKLDKLSPPQQLHDLCLKFYPGERSPKWLSPVKLPMLHFLSISSGNIKRMDDSFWDDRTETWTIGGMMLETLSDLDEDWLAFRRVMPSLRIVSASWCPRLRSFPIEDVGFKGGVWKKGVQNS